MFAFMGKFFERLDRLANIGDHCSAAVWAERTAFVFLVIAFAFAPHSIAVTQVACGIGIAASLARLLFRPRVRLRFGWLDAALWGFFAWSVLSSLLSYEPLTSVDKLRGTIVFIIFYFVLLNVSSKAAAGFLVFVLIGSCMVSVVWAPVERLIGRGIEIHGLAADGPLAKALLWEGDTLLEVDRHPVSTPEEVLSAIERNDSASVKFYRPDFEFSVEVKRADLLAGETALQRLGAASWKKSRNWRSTGFYGHYTTFAEVLQLIGSLALGLFVAAFGRRRRSPVIMLSVAVAGISVALLLTVTRAPQVAFVISAVAIILLGLGRRWLLASAVVLVPLALAGVILLQQSRDVDIFGASDESTRYRQVMLRDGLRLWSESPRHLIVGVGMDSIEERWQEWGLFEGGSLPLGHFHSTPIQILVERGLPALLIWMIILGVYARSLWIGMRHGRSSAGTSDWISHGILLGCFGGMVGFFVSGLVHYNLGDQEVAMVFFMLMGIATFVSRSSVETALDPPEAAAAVRQAA